MVDHKRRDETVEDVDIKQENVNRSENPSLVGATLIKYAAYIIILLIVLYFVITYVFPMF